MPSVQTQKYYSSFDYGSAFGKNPFSDRSRRLDDLVNRSLSSGSSASQESYIAKPGNTEVRDYMANVMGGQRNTLDDYVRRTAGAGIRRGGLNVAGGPAFESALHQNAMKTLASGYESRFRDAMNYNKYAKQTRYAMLRDSTRDLQDLLGIQQRYVMGEADWQNKLGNAMREDWRGDIDWNRSEPVRQLQLESMRTALGDSQRKSEMERWRNLVEKEERDKLVQDRNMWSQVAGKAALASRVGASVANWTSQDQALSDYLGVRMGYLQPWKRNMNFSRTSR
ncbi:MAG TPA: hypothetical protein VK463_05830 [Desulfomonilaceae bacterium]|nr:hypothetical protein [Desulfomonilaceae bacterium]